MYNVLIFFVYRKVYIVKYKWLHEIVNSTVMFPSMHLEHFDHVYPSIIYMHTHTGPLLI